MKYLDKAKLILIEVANKGLASQLPDGSFPAGHNGSRFHTETPVRNTAHWAILFLSAYRLTKKKQYVEAALSCIHFIQQDKWRPHGYTYWMREHAHKDRCNGLIGQAWVMESLLYAAHLLPDHRKQFMADALQLYRQIPFSQKIGLWHIREINGTKKSIAKTFNQQLWFASLALILGKMSNDQRVLQDTKLFFAGLNGNTFFSMLHQGLIDHMVLPTFRIYGASACYYALGRTIHEWYLSCSSSWVKKLGQYIFHDYTQLCLGYQSFNLFAFAVIESHDPSILSPEMKKKIHVAMDFCNTYPYYTHFPKSGYGYNYNPIGWEMAYVLKTFQDSDKHRERKISTWIDQQAKNYLTATYSTTHTDDANTLLARTYELNRILFPQFFTNTAT